MTNKIFLTLFLFNLSLFAQNLPPSPPDNPQVIPMSEITEGMEGVGYTVIHGTNVEPFKVKVISVLRKMWNGSDAILIELEGLNLEHSGTVAGMSGSPIYFDGKIAGALAFGWNYAKDPIAGVTPIEEMYKLYNDTNASKVASISKNSLQTPLMFSGFNGDSFLEYSDKFKEMGFYPMQAGGSISDINQSGKFLFGDSVAIVLIDGDFSIAGVGTVSHTDDEKFLLFGHSMWSKGRLRAPVSRAYINHIVASTASSFKIGAAYSNYLGYTVYDGTFGVSGVYGEVPENTMIPVNLQVEDQSFLNKDFNFRVLNDPTYFSYLLSMAIYTAVTSSAGSDEDGVFSVSYEIETDYFEEPYKVTDRILSYSSKDAFKTAIEQLIAPVDFFIYNNFNRVGIKSIKLSIKRSNLEYAFLNDITLLEPKAKAGETIHLRVGITPYGKEKTYINIPVKLPVNLTTDIYSIYAANEYIYNYAERLFMPNKYKIRSLDDVMRIYGKSYDDKALKVWLYSSSRGVQIGKDSFPMLPISKYGVMANNYTSDKASVINAIEGQFDMPYSILGLMKIDIIIEGADKYENR
ncbi:peptidase S55 SpoIVB [Brachyspira aalborgi]|uniref:Peptidase S55 SpoIVB n=1 Tax=Brachyspira aalborgi TaxID=29522 RepID=A0AB38Q1V6_9SPIR|nr:SpoIVB peptidase S55 domain-containing protein [Brachyspira aalborgi]TXJ17322.1 peptidase S55 SpoIVB [Brachyspira aalborgi]TXJ22915.1 peptidase S55 SpoIVB [Brachyspira aalborgi]TXJ26785.1 peptidase S55 SpoIVB [Brachyspira aalborgi]TXJ51586.1 peptidase S55 SpoIVB [Brachyspira aalborgi]